MTGGGIDVRISNLGGITSAELGLYVLTERPTEGHLRVDHVRGEEAW